MILIPVIHFQPNNSLLYNWSLNDLSHWYYSLKICLKYQEKPVSFWFWQEISNNFLSTRIYCLSFSNKKLEITISLWKKINNDQR